MIRHVAVVVPAANEEQRIGSCLSRIIAARDELHRTEPDVRARVIVVLDSCRDATAAIAGAFPGVDLVTVGTGNVGIARRAGAAAALGGGRRSSELWLASTDADSEVPGDWLTSMMAAERLGAHMVLGTVLPGPDLRPAARTAWLSRHQQRDGHPHVHGANLGIRADIYLALGGWRPLRTGEDAALARRAALTGHVRITRTASIPVVTSVRQVGRTPGGFSSYLRALG